MVADAFGKRHSDVLESIENIKTENSAVTSMFFETSYQAGTGKNYEDVSNKSLKKMCPDLDRCNPISGPHEVVANHDAP